MKRIKATPQALAQSLEWAMAQIDPMHADITLRVVGCKFCNGQANWKPECDHDDDCPWLLAKTILLLWNIEQRSKGCRP